MSLVMQYNICPDRQTDLRASFILHSSSLVKHTLCSQHSLTYLLTHSLTPWCRSDSHSACQI